MEKVLVVPSVDLRTSLFTRDTPGKFLWKDRDSVEKNPDFVQIIPFVVLEDGEGRISVFTNSNTNEARLTGQRSVGVGGHINPIDEVKFDQLLSIEHTLIRCILRELSEEVGWSGPLNIRQLKGGPIHLPGRNSVDDCHVGLPFLTPVNPRDLVIDSREIQDLTFVRPKDLENAPLDSWSSEIIHRLLYFRRYK